MLVLAIHRFTTGRVYEVRITWDGPDPVANDPIYGSDS